MRLHNIILIGCMGVILGNSMSQAQKKSQQPYIYYCPSSESITCTLTSSKFLNDHYTCVSNDSLNPGWLSYTVQTSGSIGGPYKPLGGNPIDFSCSYQALTGNAGGAVIKIYHEYVNMLDNCTYDSSSWSYSCTGHWCEQIPCPPAKPAQKRSQPKRNK